MSESAWKEINTKWLILQAYAEAIGIIAVAIGVLIFLLWRPKGMPRQLLGPQRWPEIPWQLAETLLAVFFLYFLDTLLWSTMHWWSNPKLDPPAYAGFQIGVAATGLLGSQDGGTTGGITMLLGALESAKFELDRQLTIIRNGLVHKIVMFPVLLILVIGMMSRSAGAKPYQMGLHLGRWKENLTLGYFTWLIAMPLAILILVVVNFDFWETLWGRSAAHPIAKVLFRDPSLMTFLLSLVVVSVVAPIGEELLLRGIIQPYLVRMPIVSDFLVVFMIVWAIVLLLTPGTGPDRGAGMGPLLFVCTVAPGYYLFEKWTARWLTEPGAARGVFVSSLIFAILHGPVWPSPIPLFALSIFLGLLAYRTGSLVGPILVHSLFNITSMIYNAIKPAAL